MKILNIATKLAPNKYTNIGNVLVYTFNLLRLIFAYTWIEHGSIDTF